MIRNFKTYRKYITESLDRESLGQYLQERGLELLKEEGEVEGNWIDTIWFRSKKGLLYKVYGFSVDALESQSVYLTYWDWASREGGMDPYNRDPGFVAVPTFGPMSFKKAVERVQQIDNKDGVYVLYQVSDKGPEKKFDPTNPTWTSKREVFIESKYLTDLETFKKEALRKIGDFHRCWYFKDGLIYLIYKDYKTNDYDVKVVEPYNQNMRIYNP
jgi:hypothetical protein